MKITFTDTSKAILDKYWLGLIFYGVIFAAAGLLVIQNNLIIFSDGEPLEEELLIIATGEKNIASKSAEIWFHGAFSSETNERLPWHNFEIDPAWEARDLIYLSYKGQPSRIKANIKQGVRLDFGSHPYSGKLTIKFKGSSKTIDLYSKEATARSIVLDPRLGLKDSPYYPLIIFSLFALGMCVASLRKIVDPRKIDTLVSGLLLLLSVYMSLSAFYPGVYTPDSGEQLYQALEGRYTDWHPPLMAWVWSILIGLTDSFTSLFFAHHIILLLAGFAWIGFFARLGFSRLALLVPLLLASPLLTNFSGVVWKDVGYAFSMLLAAGILANFTLSKRLTFFGIFSIFCLLVYAYGVRMNGVFAVFPLLYAMFFIVVKQKRRAISPLRIYFLAGSLAIFSVFLIVSGIFYFKDKIIDAEKSYAFQYVQLYDIAGISAISGGDYFPEYIKSFKGYDIEKIKNGYGHGSANNLIYSVEPLLPLSNDSLSQTELKSSWLASILHEPLAYLEHRWAVFSFLMEKKLYSQERVQSNEDRMSLFKRTNVNTDKINVVGVDFPGYLSSRRFINKTHSYALGSIIYSGWFWLSILIVQMVSCAFLEKSPFRFVLFTIALSGVLYILPYFVVSPASSFRYLYWGSISGAFGVLIVAAVLIQSTLNKIKSMLPDKKAVALT
uniref:Uncharacterized protein n=1 Tax=Candidatus Kentrum sp. LPFa TaxID=2126335 RepID=A0A450W402_9GAMM|nr:MAG: hypothetical protein BECKLPF1236B_GA0070989_102412 [Candidatus Kentron sp. LPFa]